MSARARITAADLAQAATVAKAEGVSVTISANGKTFTVAPVDAREELGQSAESDPFAAWKAKREARREGRA